MWPKRFTIEDLIGSCSGRSTRGMSITDVVLFACARGRIDEVTRTTADSSYPLIAVTMIHHVRALYAVDVGGGGGRILRTG